MLLLAIDVGQPTLTDINTALGPKFSPFPVPGMLTELLKY